MLSGDPRDQGFRDHVNKIAYREQNVPYNQLPFTQNRDGMGILSVIVEELELSPGHFYVSNNDDNEWIAVVRFDTAEDDDLQAIIGTGNTAYEAIAAVEKKLKDIYS